MNVIEFDEKELKKDIEDNLNYNDKEDEISKALDIINEKTKELVSDDRKEISEPIQKKDYSIDDIIDITLESFKDVKEKSDEIYNAFYGTVATRQDRSDVSKQMLVESQRLKNESIQNLVSLANAKAKMIQAQNKANSGNTGIIINTSSADQVGIDLSNLKDES